MRSRTSAASTCCTSGVNVITMLGSSRPIADATVLARRAGVRHRGRARPGGQCNDAVATTAPTIHDVEFVTRNKPRSRRSVRIRVIAA